MRRFSMVWRIANKYRLGPTQLEELLQLVLANPVGRVLTKMGLCLTDRTVAASVDPSGDGTDSPQIPPAVTPRDGLLVESLVARQMVRSQAILDRLQTDVAMTVAAMASGAAHSTATGSAISGAEALQMVANRLNTVIQQGRAEATAIERAALSAADQLAVSLVGRPGAECEALAELVTAAGLPIKLQLEPLAEGPLHFSADSLAADLTCLLVGSDASPSAELGPLVPLLLQDKLVTVILIYKENLQHAVRRERFLGEPDRWRSVPDGPCQYFKDYLTCHCREHQVARPPVYPIHLSAAQQSRTETDAAVADSLRKGSNLDEFVAALRSWGITERQTRRLAGLLKQSTGAYCRQIDALYGELQLIKRIRVDLHNKLQELSGNVRAAHAQACKYLDMDMTQLDWNMQTAVSSWAKTLPQRDARILSGALMALIDQKEYSRQAAGTLQAYEDAFRNAIGEYVTGSTVQSALLVLPPALQPDASEVTVNARILSVALKAIASAIKAGSIPFVSDLVAKYLDLSNTVNDERQKRMEPAARWARAKVEGLVKGWREAGIKQLNQLREHVWHEGTATLHSLSQHLGCLAQNMEDALRQLQEEETALCTALVQQLVVDLVPANRPAPVVISAHRNSPKQLIMETKTPLTDPVSSRLQALLMLNLQYRER